MGSLANRPQWMHRAPPNLRAVDACIACGEPSTSGRLCRGCRLDLRVCVPLARAAVYGDFAGVRAIDARVRRFEEGCFG